MDTSVCIINELTQGMELANRLKSILSSESSPETKQVLIQGIISSLDRTLLIINRVDSGAQSPPMLSLPESSVSADQEDQKVVSKKRKGMPAWKNQIRMSTDNGLEGNTDDGYSWRKYGQKDILGAKFPRSYYRCTYRYVHNCMARKQVQRTDEDPTVFEITYRGRHTCNPATAPPQSPEKHDTKQNNHQQPPPPASFGSINNYQQFNFSSEADHNFSQGYSPFFASPTTSRSNYFTEWGNDQEDLSLNFAINNSGFFI